MKITFLDNKGYMLGFAWIKLRSFFNPTYYDRIEKTQPNPTHHRSSTQPNPTRLDPRIG